MKHNRTEYIRSEIMNAIRFGDKETKVFDLVVSIDFNPQVEGTVTQKWIYFEKWLSDKVNEVNEVLKHRIK